MAYTSPRTWVAGELVTAAIMNTYIRDNQNALKDPPSDQYVLNEGSDYTTTSTSFTDVDATNLALSVTTTGGVVEVHFHGTVDNSGANRTYFEIDVDGSPYAGDDGIIYAPSQAGDYPIAFTIRVDSLSAGAHTFKLQWKVSAGTATLYAGAGTSNFDMHPEMWIVER